MMGFSCLVLCLWCAVSCVYANTEEQAIHMKEDAAAPDTPEPPHPPSKGGQSVSTASGLLLPRFVSLKASKANMHRGPVQSSEIQWVYTKPKMPLEILAEHDHWRQVRDYQGTTGWMHKVLLSGKRYVMVQKNVAQLRAKPTHDSDVIATVEPGVIGKLLECKGASCHVDIEGVKGWVSRTSLFGVYPDEEKIG